MQILSRNCLPVQRLEGESEAEYVARQKRLQEAARERIRQKFGAASMGSVGGGGDSAAPSASPSSGFVKSLSSLFW